ncbi:cytoplasmic polyadenylation element-binding protein 2 isoform X4 [Salmo salar]|uniref:Cytoplasmic polyadenylation element-binding protein 2 isoform X4 n=1 Tax=Salmo salar TaxID=8030 RepID=A0A1S3KII2_SALSA|nr:cytoplasmic polyadenylation element-binding protein 2 isoform X4 [Salmo salar]|eukprot:XP_013978387.1 PREDICTED: cytoplasmic polyadenylation element-binding protein 2-like isoform X4 [Salmo salar]
MDSPITHHINNGNGSSTGNMLSAGLGGGFPNLQNQEMQNPSGASASPPLPGFGTPWSVQTSSPPPVSNSANPIHHSNAINQMPHTDPDNSFYPGIPSSINPAFFQSFSPVSTNPCPGINVQGFSSQFSPQINAHQQPQQQSRRSPVSPQMHPQHHQHQQGAFLQQRNNYNHHHQERSRMYDSLNMHSLESSLIDIMRAEQDPMKGRVGCPHPGADGLLMLNARSYGRRRGRSSLFPIEDSLLDDGHGNQGIPGLSPNCYPHQNGERIERFSRKVFVGGLPPDIDEDEITNSFRRFGHLVVDWPHKAESKSYFPPKGYAFLLFQEESSVQALIEACMEEDGKLYLCVSSPTIKDKPVQIRPWNLSDSDFVMDGSQPLDPRKTIFVGGVPRPLRAVELAMIMDRLYGGVCYAGIDTDPELKYPKGAGRVAFSNQQSYIAAISARFVQLQHGDIDKRVEVKPYVLDDQLCDECQGARCGGKFAPFFCANVTCLQYYCEFCWANIHSRAGREFHKPLVKEGADRPRQINFRWN